jgi:hypothetical protein
MLVNYWIPKLRAKVRLKVLRYHVLASHELAYTQCDSVLRTGLDQQQNPILSLVSYFIHMERRITYIVLSSMIVV